MDVLEVKQRRSRAKQEVTTTARRLKNLLNREVDLEALNDLFLDLELAYDNFCEINEEFEVLVSSEEFAEHRVVNGKDLKEYESRVKQVYEEAKVEFSEQKTTRVQKQAEIQIFPLKAALSRSVIKIKELADGIKENIGSEHLDMHLLQEDKCELDRLSNEMWDNMSKLGFVGGIKHAHEEEEVHEIQRLVCSLKRDIDKYLRNHLDNRVHVSGVQAPTPESPTVYPQSTTGTLVSQPIIYTTETPAVTHPSAPSTENQVVLQSGVTNTGYPPVTSPTLPSLSFYNTSHHLPEKVSCQPWSQRYNFSVSGVQASTPVTPTVYPQCTTGTPVSEPIIYTSGTTAVSYPSVPSTGNPVILQSNVMNTGYPSFTSPNFYESPRRPPVQVNYQPWSRGNSFPGGVAFSSNSDVRLKKISLPVFSGQRKDWPEFKTVWKQLAENAYTNQAALASELKRSVRGEAKERIKSVYVTKPEAYEIMWKKLETYYNDTSASVQSHWGFRAL